MTGRTIVPGNSGDRIRAWRQHPGRLPSVEVSTRRWRSAASAAGRDRVRPAHDGVMDPQAVSDDWPAASAATWRIASASAAGGWAPDTR